MALERPVIGFDSETHLISDEAPVPPMVCYTAAGGEDTLAGALALLLPPNTALPPLPAVVVRPDAWLRVRETDHGVEWEALVLASRAVDLHVGLTALYPEAVLVAHNAAFDWSGLLKLCPDLLPLLVHFLESGQAADTHVREQLWAIATDNFKFDNRVGRSGGFGLAHCVLARFNVDLSSDKTKLSTLVKNEVPKPQWPWRYRYDELEGVAVDQWPQEAIHYAVEDATWARRLYIDQAKPLTLDAGPVVLPEGTVVNEKEQTCFAWFLQKMREHGVRTDNAAVSEFEKEVHAMVEEALAAGRAAGFIVINRCKECLGTGLAGDVPALQTCAACLGKDHEACNSEGRYGFYKSGKAKTLTPPKSQKSTKRLRELVEHAYGGYPPLTDKGSTSTAAETLEGSGHPLLKKYAEGSFAIKLRDTYIPILQRGTEHPIYSEPRVLVRSGRTSWGDPNFQNPPQRGGFRECFVPRKGNVFCSIDYAALEMATLAQANLLYFGYSRMAELINEGKDLHLVFAVENYLHDLTYDEALAIRKDPDHPRHAEVNEARDRAKPGNFGFPGGMYEKGFREYAKSYGINMDLNDAAAARAGFLATYPEMNDYFAMMQGKQRASLTGLFEIRQLGSGRVRGGCHMTSGCNTVFQGLAADGAKAAGWALYKEMINPASPLYGVGVWAFVHDEYLFEGPEGTAHVWAPYAADIMVKAMKKYVPDVRIAAEPALMRRWSKKADTAYRDGKLIPWEDR